MERYGIYGRPNGSLLSEPPQQQLQLKTRAAEQLKTPGCFRHIFGGGFGNCQPQPKFPSFPL